MQRKMRVMSYRGDDVVAEYDTETTSPEEMKEIEAEFDRFVANGYFAADITDKRDVFIKKFDPSADILLIGRVQGGSHGATQ